MKVSKTEASPMKLLNELIVNVIVHAYKSPSTISGVLLIGFLLVHGLGNLKVLKGRQSYNAHGYQLHSTPGFAVVELTLAGIFATHILGSSNSYLKFLRRLSRMHHGGLSDLGLRNLLSHRQTKAFGSGLLILGFLIQHIKDFRAKGEDDIPKDKIIVEDNSSKDEKATKTVLVKDIYTIAAKRMKDSRGFLLYTISLLIIAFHLQIAVQPGLTMRIGIPFKYNNYFLFH